MGALSTAISGMKTSVCFTLTFATWGLMDVHHFQPPGRNTPAWRQRMEEVVRWGADARPPQAGTSLPRGAEGYGQSWVWLLVDQQPVAELHPAVRTIGRPRPAFAA